MRGGRWLAIAALALACGGDDATPTEPPGAPVAEELEIVVETPAPVTDEITATASAVQPAATAGEAESETAAADSTLKSPVLDDLLRVPPPKPPTPPLLLEVEQEAAAAQQKKASRFGVAIDSRDDPVSVDGKTTRKQTDASVSVDVSESTKVRGGVRVQENQEGVEQDRVPTVGIEKRF
jgi:hypothetical protein